MATESSTDSSSRDAASEGESSVQCESPRAYDGWWFKDIAADSAKKGKSPVEAWVPFPVIDNDRLEQGLVDPSFREFPDELLVHDESLQRTCKVSYSRMEMSPLYWMGTVRPVRRAIWMEMNHLTDNTQGGKPVAADFDAAIEEVYKANLEWIQTPAWDRIVERIVPLPEPLAAHALIIRQGVLDGAWLTRQEVLEKKQDQSTRLVRGYIPYFIAVVAAIQGGTDTLGRDKSHEPFLTLASPFEARLAIRPLNPPRELVFAVHGIGQKFAQRMGKNFVQDCDFLRQGISSAISQRGGCVDDVLLLPVNWRSGLKMGVRTWFPETGEVEEESFEDLVTRITLENIPAIRDAASDVGLDILLYMTPAYFERIIESTLGEIRRQYQLFSTVYGEQAKKSRVSLIGHSLGSAIIADFLSVIVTDDASSSLKKGARDVCKKLGFVVDRFFALGSPIAMLFLLKQMRPVNCINDIYELQLLENARVDDEEKAPTAERKYSIPEPEESHVLKPRDFVFACRQFYNIFHPFDPSKPPPPLRASFLTSHLVAYRIEPLVVPPCDMTRFALPVKLPYFKKGALKVKRRMEESLQVLMERAGKAKEEIKKSLNALPSWLKTLSVLGSSAEAIEDEPPLHPPCAPRTPPFQYTHPNLMRFNRHGRIDFSVEEALLTNSYISALTAHIDYWHDVDVAAFLAVELCDLPMRPATSLSPQGRDSV